MSSYSGVECYLSRLFNTEHPLPAAAVEDSITVYRALIHKNILPSQLFVMGDSAGGGLSLLTVQAIITHKLPVPSGIIGLSPWTDLSISGESYTRNTLTEVLYTVDDLKWLIKQMSIDHPQV